MATLMERVQRLERMWFYANAMDPDSDRKARDEFRGLCEQLREDAVLPGSVDTFDAYDAG